MFWYLPPQPPCSAEGGRLVTAEIADKRIRRVLVAIYKDSQTELWYMGPRHRPGAFRAAVRLGRG